MKEKSNFVMKVSRLKLIPRSGWISCNVFLQEVESVADHTFSTSAIAMLIADREVKRGTPIKVERVLRMSLLHDLAEALTFDISKSYLNYLGKKGEEMKKELERTAWNHMIQGVHPASIRMNYARLQSEFNADETLEAQIVHAADKLDILFQIIEYSRRGYGRTNFDDLWENTNHLLKNVRLSSVQRLRELAVKLHRG